MTGEQLEVLHEDNVKILDKLTKIIELLETQDKWEGYHPAPDKPEVVPPAEKQRKRKDKSK